MKTDLLKKNIAQSEIHLVNSILQKEKKYIALIYTLWDGTK